MQLNPRVSLNGLGLFFELFDNSLSWVDCGESHFSVHL